MAGMVDVYRVENEDGMGAYSCGAVDSTADALRISSDDGGYGDRHPAPYLETWEGFGKGDGVLALVQSHLCVLTEAPPSAVVFGFCTREQADAWFRPDHRAAMVEHAKVQVRHYRVPAHAVVKAGHQCVFSRKAAKLVGAVDPVTLEPPVPPAHPLKVGDILVAGWGYDQTNNTYLKVLRVLPKSVEVVEIGQRRTETGFMQGTSVPAPDEEIDRCVFFRKRTAIKRADERGTIRLSSYAWARKWDGQPCWWSSYG